jgi:two-component system response regulator TtrR
MVAGKKNRQIAEDLGISTKTLDIHRANIMRKMQTKTVADLVRWRLMERADPLAVQLQG